jgi:hypothetical protein
MRCTEDAQAAREEEGAGERAEEEDRLAAAERAGERRMRKVWEEGWVR